MTMQENKSVICDLIESGSSGDWHRLEDLVAEDYVDHCKWKNREGLIQTFRTFREVYPDFKIRVDEIIAEGEAVAARVIATGSTMGEEGEASALVWFRLKEGKVVEQWGHSESFF